MATKTKQVTRQQLLAIRATMRAAEQTRCACGDTGSWNDDDVVYGETAGQPAVWAGCPNCAGHAVGAPLNPADLDIYRAHAEEFRWQIEAADVLAAARGRHPNERDYAGRLADWPTEIYPRTIGDSREYAIPLSTRGIHIATVYAVIDADGEIVTRLVPTV